MKHKIIGVDPAIRKSGFAIAILSNNLFRFETFPNGFIEFIEWWQVFFFQSIDPVTFVVENSNLQNASFHLNGPPPVIARMARNVGMNQAISQATVDYLRSQGQRVVELSPKEKGKKLTQDEFVALCQEHNVNISKRRTNQDERDAGKLALMGLNRCKMEL